jgi:hypothetical protein
MGNPPARPVLLASALDIGIDERKTTEGKNLSAASVALSSFTYILAAD